MTVRSMPQNNNKRKRHRARIEELAVLPVFFKLRDKSVVLIGGSDAAAWKGELLAASGAIVHIYATELDPVFLELIAEKPDSFIHHDRPWSIDIFSGNAITIADAENEAQAKAIYCASRAAGVPVNIIDKPEFCEFQFGSIVNRSPAIVSISTDGAAPILGQAIRRRIETLLPASLKNWAQMASDLRGYVNDHLSMGQKRRQFWERFVDHAFGASPNDNSKDALIKDIDKIRSGNEGGKVTLVGAGPGDSELLTLKAVRALQSADVILFDDLVSSDVLELARREAKRLLVGKRGGRESCKQQDINNMMVKLAKSGKNVVRLKSGDPMIFGRAGEEIARLERENIPVSVVAGVTAASAMASRLGASMTHRDCAQSVRFVTGHSKKGALPEDVDWKAISDPTTTTIFYMSGRTASQIKERVIGEGLDPHTPVVIASSISREDEKMWFGTLSDLDVGISEIGYEQPVLIGLGQVFAKRRRLPLSDNFVAAM